MKVRREKDRGFFDFGWLKASYTFSFASFVDPEFMGFESLRVINNDIIAPSGGFDTHSHKNMEILTFVLSGEVEHKDTIGNHTIIRPGEIQLMSAGSGISHSEYNPSSSRETELFQIWVKPNQKNTEPRYDQFSYIESLKLNKPLLIASSQKIAGVAHIYQNVEVYINKFNKEAETLELNKNSRYWLQMIEGAVKVNDIDLFGRDGIGLNSGEIHSVETNEDAYFLLFEFKE